MVLHLIAKVQAHASAVRQLKFVSGLPRLLSKGIDDVLLMDGHTGKQITKLYGFRPSIWATPTDNRFFFRLDNEWTTSRQHAGTELFDTNEGDYLYTLDKSTEAFHRDRGLTFVGDSKLVSNHNDELHIWDWKANELLHEIIGLGGESVWKIPEQSHIITHRKRLEYIGTYVGSDAYSILSCWSIDDGKRLWHLEGGPTETPEPNISEINSSALSHDGSILILGCDIVGPRLVKWRTGEVLSVPDLDKRLYFSIRAVLSTSDGQHLIFRNTGIDPPSYWVMAMENWGHYHFEFHSPSVLGYTNYIWSETLIQQETALAITTYGASVHILSLTDGTELLATNINEPRDHTFWSQVIHNEEYQLIVTHAGHIYLVSLKSGRQEAAIKLTQPVIACALLHNEKQLVIVGKTGCISLFSVESRLVESTLSPAKDVELTSWAISTDELTLAIGDKDGMVSLIGIE